MCKDTDTEIKGVIFDIQRCSIHDGPGIRTTVFLKGCPLRCKWCHNPESWSFTPEIMFNKDKCVLCQSCVDICPVGAHSIVNDQHVFNRELCTACGKCAAACLFEALELKGTKMLVGEVLQEVNKDIEYYINSGGGLTVSGGEPLAQFDFTYSLLKEAKNTNIHTCIETSGFVSHDILVKILPLVDLFLFDYKATGSEQYKELTGVSNKIILENLDYIYKHGVDIILRCPMIPGINDSDEHLKGIANISEKYPELKGIEIMAYHNLGVEKNDRLGKDPYYKDLGNTKQEQKDKWLTKLKEYGCSKAIIG